MTPGFQTRVTACAGAASQSVRNAVADQAPFVAYAASISAPVERNQRVEFFTLGSDVRARRRRPIIPSMPCVIKLIMDLVFGPEEQIAYVSVTTR